MGSEQHRLRDCLVVWGVWIVILAGCLAFWAAVGWGIYEAQAAIWPDAPACTYSGVTMHQHWGTSSASCAYP